VLAVLAVLIWGIYGYVTARSQHEDLVKGTYPTLLTLVGLAAIAFIVWKAMRFMISDLSLDPMYWAVPIFGAIGGIFGSLGENNSFALASVEGSTNIKAGILGDIVAGIGGSIAVVFVSERTLKLEPGKADSLLSLASISFIAGAAGRKLVQLAVEKFLKTSRGKEESGSREQPQAQNSKNAAPQPSAAQTSKKADEDK